MFWKLNIQLLYEDQKGFVFSENAEKKYVCVVLESFNIIVYLCSP